MKFLIQTIDNHIVHDFSFVLLESIKYQNWLKGDNSITFELTEGEYKSDYIPVGSVEFVTKYLETYYNKVYKPINIPQDLLKPHYINRDINFYNKNELPKGKFFLKSMDKIKFFTEIVNTNNEYQYSLIPDGNYLVSDIVEFESEWRVFVYRNKMVGLQNYVGNFTMFPNVDIINNMIKDYKNSPVSYTLDIGIHDNKNSIIEVHDFFSCGLYGFSDHTVYPYMLSNWFYEYVRK